MGWCVRLSESERERVWGRTVVVAADGVAQRGQPLVDALHHHLRCVVVTEAGSYLRLVHFCITQLKAQGPSRTCNESREEEEEPPYGIKSKNVTHKA